MFNWIIAFIADKAGRRGSRCGRSKFRLPGGSALSASYDNTLRLWDLENGNSESKIVADDPITAFALAAEEGRGIAALANGKIFLFELSSVASNIA